MIDIVLGLELDKRITLKQRQLAGLELAAKQNTHGNKWSELVSVDFRPKLVKIVVLYTLSYVNLNLLVEGTFDGNFSMSLPGFIICAFSS